MEVCLLTWNCSLCGKQMFARTQEEVNAKNIKHVDEECRIAKFLNLLPPDTTGKELLNIVEG